MMKHEFDELVGVTTTQASYETIEYVYMNTDQFKTKQDIADFYKENDYMRGIEKLYKDHLEKLNTKQEVPTMKKLKHYNTHTNHNTQEELQRLANDILSFGTIEGISHHNYSTNRHTKGAEMENIDDGMRCYLVTGFRTRYWVHFSGLRVTGIIEETEIIK